MQNCSCCSINILSYPLVVYPGAPWTVSGTITSAASGSPFVSVGATPSKCERPANLILATMSGNNWTATFSCEYTTFYIWAELTLQDNVHSISCLVTPGTSNCCPKPQSGDRSVLPNFRYFYPGPDNTFYYGGQ